MNTLPKARTENLVEQNINKETLLYDLLTDKAFKLNETSSIIYKACGGKTSLEEIKRKHKFSDDFIYLALDELKRNDLLANEVNYASPFANTSRREVIKKVGFASMFVLPIVSGLVAPQAIHAASNSMGGGGNGGIITDAKFLDYCTDIAGGPFCQRTGDPETSFACVNNTCCVQNTQGSLAPGATFDMQYFVLPVDGDCPPSDNCINDHTSCCSGETAQGYCPTTPIYFGDDNELVACKVSCTCTCL